MSTRRVVRLHGVVVACVFAATLGGCASPQLELQTPPAPRILDARVPPDPLNLTTNVRLEQAKTSAEELAAHVTVAKDPGLTGDQSVVIAVPASEATREAGKLDLEEGLAEGDGVAAIEFRTSSYFAQAEQQIERSLLEKEFRLLDRAKFEAKLRSQRAEAALSADKASADRELGRTELTDIAELIRATEEGENRADYIFRVDTFAIRPSSDETVHLLDFQEFEDLCNEHAGLRQAIVAAGAESIVKPGFSAVLNARLIRVADGEIVWVGRHKIGTQHVLDNGFTVTLPVTKSVSNADMVNSELTAFNATQRGLYEQCVFLKDEIERKVQDRDFRNRRERDEAIAEYDATCAALMQAKLVEPLALNQAWTYQYGVDTPYARPALPTTDDVDRLSKQMADATTLQERSDIRRKYRQYQEFLAEHFTELAELVSSELIGTVP